MKILQIIHGYPMRYNAGSEVYTQTLCHGLVQQGHEIQVFTREENPFADTYQVRQEVDNDEPSIIINLINLPDTRDRYQHPVVDQALAQLLDKFTPNIVHIGHLNHLSTSLIREIAKRAIPIIYTLHDYWVMCPRGQFMQMLPTENHELWAVCDGQDDRKCAERCYARYASGNPKDYEQDIQYWTDWVKRRMYHLHEMAELVDCFIAPAHYLYKRYQRDFGLPRQKLTYLDYGFDIQRLQGRQRINDENFVFGYIGTHIPAKGIHLLIQAFGKLTGKNRLRIYGRFRDQNTKGLQAIAHTLPIEVQQRIEWLPEYRNQDIINDVFNHVDAIVVPSIWMENSPLVIHEAQQARVPVITADMGGMAEYVHHEVNGLLFKHRDSDALAQQMQRFIDNTNWAKQLGARGYLYSATGNIPELTTHVKALENIYYQAIQRRRPLMNATPWRITLDTNPDHCNLHCIMCEEHALASPRYQQRKTEHIQKREMSRELLQTALIQAHALGIKEVIPSTMGEPLLYPYIDDIINFCQQQGLTLNLTTNGTFPRYGAQKWAEKIVPIASDIKISWNSLEADTQEKIMFGSRYDKMRENLEILLQVRNKHFVETGYYCRITLQMTFLEWNYIELPTMARFAIQQGVDRLKGHHLWTHFDSLKSLSMRRHPESIQRWNQAVIQAQTIANTQPLNNGNFLKLENIFCLDETAPEDLAPTSICPFLGREIWISSEGRFNPCCAPDEQRRTLGDFGTLADKSLAEIWHSDEYQFLLKTYQNRALCLGCNMRVPYK